MTVDSLARWLRCPGCGQELRPVAGTVLGCSSGHRFDVNRRGYASLLGGRSATTGDTAPMLDARDAVLGSGAYDPVLEIVDAVTPSDGGGRIIDVGTGTGHYLDRLLDSRRKWLSLAVDRSPTAVARATRRTGADGLVADVWHPLPIRDAAASVILNVFAPRNPEEFHRVLEAGGALIVVVPQDDHLVQLTDAGRALAVAPGKAGNLIDGLSPWFEHDQSREVRYLMPAGSGLVDALIGMGPSAHHSARAAASASEGTVTTGHPTRGTGSARVSARPESVTVAVSALRFRRRRHAR